MKKLPHTHSCFVCGLTNPVGLKLDFETDGITVQARFVARHEHVGFKETLHGGILATILDEVMVWACGVQTGHFAYCAELNVRYLLPVRPGDEIHAVAGPIVNRRGKLFEATGELRDSRGNVLTTATGKYLPIKEVAAAELAADFIGDTSMLSKNRSS